MTITNDIAAREWKMAVRDEAGWPTLCFWYIQIAIGSVPNLTGRRLNSGDDDLDTALVLDELELLVGSRGGGGGDGQEAARNGGDEAGVQGVQVLRARVVADGETHQ